MIRRTLYLTFVTLLVTALIAACAPIAPTGQEPAAQPAQGGESAGPVTITVAAQSGHTGATAAKDI
jgi:hypothetical protein